MKKLFSAVLISCALAVCAVLASAAEKNTEPVKVDAVVNDSSGKPIPNAVIYYVPEKALINVAPPKYALHTDAAGKCSFWTTQMKKLYYIAVADGYSYSRGAYKEGSNEVTFTLWPEKVIKGKVVDELGAPVSGAVVKMLLFSGENDRWYILPKMSAQRFEVLTDKNGEFVLEHLPDPKCFERADLRLEPSKKGHASVSRWFFTKDVRRPGVNDLDKEIILHCPKAATLQGKLTFPSDLKLTSKRFLVWVSYRDDETNEFCFKYYNVGASGDFRIKDLPPNKVTLTIEQVNRQEEHLKEQEFANPAIRDIELKPNETKKLNIPLQHGAIITGTVVDAETQQPKPHWPLSVRHAGFLSDSYVFSLVADDNGKFSVRVAAGEAKIAQDTSQLPTYSDQPVLKLNVSDGETKSGVVISVPKPKN